MSSSDNETPQQVHTQKARGTDFQISKAAMVKTGAGHYGPLRHEVQDDNIKAFN